MKLTFSIIGGLIVGLAIGVFIGHSYGYQQRNAEQHQKSYSQLITELRQKELLTINDFVKISSDLKTIDEGGLFSVKKVNYLTGTIENAALATAIKDIKLKIDYLSPTKSIISSEEITIYDIISPSHSKNFREKILLPDKTAEWQFTLVDLKTD